MRFTDRARLRNLIDARSNDAIANGTHTPGVYRGFAHTTPAGHAGLVPPKSGHSGHTGQHSAVMR